MDSLGSGPNTLLNEPSPFSGGNLTDCLKFISSIRKYARAQGTQRDNIWIADYVACCLDGEALLWHLQLPSEVAEDWSKLQRALADHYSTSDPYRVIPEAQLPSPGALTTTTRAVRYDARMGYIQIQSEGLSEPIYIGCLGNIVQGQSLAMLLHFTSSDIPHEIQIMSRNLWDQNTRVGLFGIFRLLTDDSSDVWTDESFRAGTITPDLWRNPTTGGPIRSAAWIISSDGVVTPSWGHVGTAPLRWLCQEAINPTRHLGLLPLLATKSQYSQVLHLVADAARYIKRLAATECTYREAKLVFVPLKNI
ncbi:hypothetical protein FRB93_009306 [Tulasnella sp. JGI-2019a]|nr:hypothetical protein FRB93_009306 [Tulasnella sp. JGI-2019a]